MLLIITSSSDKLFIDVNVDDLEWPWIPNTGVFSDFFVISGCDTHFKSDKWLEMDGQPAYDIFGVERTFLRI